nr:MAG TPA: hypothetical protein [Caudoviricetes sp.]
MAIQANAEALKNLCRCLKVRPQENDIIAIMGIITRCTRSANVSKNTECQQCFFK